MVDNEVPLQKSGNCWKSLEIKSTLSHGPKRRKTLQQWIRREKGSRGDIERDRTLKEVALVCPIQQQQGQCKTQSQLVDLIKCWPKRDGNGDGDGDGDDDDDDDENDYGQ